MYDRGIRGALVLAVLAVVLPTACGGDEITKVVTVGPPANTGEAGESCSAPTDCAEGLSCLRGVCVASEADLHLGQAGESCSSNADCAAELSCVANVCTDPAAGGPQGKRGESCDTRADCEEGLTCINGTCTIEEFGLEPTGKVCMSSACGAVEDCVQNVNCSFYEAQCLAAPASIYCDAFEANCNEDNWECNAGACEFVGTCATDNNCPTSLRCDPDSMTCVECHAADTLLCGANEECVDNVCQTSCLDNADCPLFFECNTDDNTCVEVGCQTARECVAFTNNALAECSDEECVVPCQTDSECDNPFNYNFKACVDGFCVSVGCDTDEECRIYNGNFGNWSCVEP
jgi:hypothetical protein